MVVQLFCLLEIQREETINYVREDSQIEVEQKKLAIISLLVPRGDIANSEAGRGTFAARPGVLPFADVESCGFPPQAGCARDVNSMRC